MQTSFPNSQLGLPRVGAARWRERKPALSSRIGPSLAGEKMPAAHSSVTPKHIQSGSRSRVPARTVCNSSTGCLTVFRLTCAPVAATRIACPLRRRNKTRSEVSSASPTQAPQISSSSSRSGICIGSLSPATPAVTIKSSVAKSKCTWTQGGSLRHPRAPAGGVPALSGSGVAGSAIMNLQLEPHESAITKNAQRTFHIFFNNWRPITLNAQSFQNCSTFSC